MTSMKLREKRHRCARTIAKDLATLDALSKNKSFDGMMSFILLTGFFIDGLKTLKSIHFMVLQFRERSEGQDFLYPWGNDEATCEFVVMQESGDGCGTYQLFPVCSRPLCNTQQGLCDMAGNAGEMIGEKYTSWELCDDGLRCCVDDDRCEAGEYAPTDGSAWVVDGEDLEWVVRGGSYKGTIYGLQTVFRSSQRNPLDKYTPDLGFRCVKK